MRASGWSALIGRKARPVSRMASAATICSTPFSITMATSAIGGIESSVCSSCATAPAHRRRADEGQRARLGDHGNGVWRCSGHREHRFVQQVVGNRSARGVEPRDQRTFALRHQRPIGRVHADGVSARAWRSSTYAANIASSRPGGNSARGASQSMPSPPPLS